MDLTKIFGWALLSIGLAVIIFSLYSSFNIFKGRSLPPEVFKIEIKAEVSNGVKGTQKITNQSLEDIRAQMETALQEQLKGIIPADSIVKLLNLISWSIFATLLIFGGGQIAGLGIKLIKK